MKPFKHFLLCYVGDIVGVFANRQPLSERRVSGIVIRKDNISISVAFDELDLLELDAHNGSLQIVKLSNDVTYLRMKRYSIL